MLSSFCMETVVVSRAPLVGMRGAFGRNWLKAERHYVAGCSVQFNSSSSTRTKARQGSTSTSAVLFAAPCSDIIPGDRIESSCGTFCIEGEPMEHVSPTGSMSHVECELSRWRG